MQKLAMFIVFTVILLYLLKSLPMTLPRPFTKKMGVSKFWITLEEKVKNRQVFNNTIYGVYKGPQKLMYIHRSKDVHKFIQDMSFIMKYQEDIYFDIVIYMEHFLRIHYKILIKKYDAASYLPILQDLQQIMLYLMSTCAFNLPRTSTIVDVSSNIDEYMQVKTRTLHAILSKYISVLKHSLPYGIDDIDPHDPISMDNIIYPGV